MTRSNSIHIKPVPADDREGLETARRLFIRYADWLSADHGVSLEFQGIDEELASLPGKYAAPTGALMLAEDNAGHIVGCVALRKFKGRTCEIKRLYVLPEGRGKSVGHKLVAAILHTASELGYERAVLDTGGFMKQAQRLYESFGFTDIPAYYDNPVPGTRYLGTDLSSTAS